LEAAICPEMQFQQPIILQKAIESESLIDEGKQIPVGKMRCPLPFWYSTLSQISDRTTPDLNLLPAA
jgi:hypothetical protein